MHTIFRTFYLAISASIILISCTQDDVPVPDTLLGNFTAQVAIRQANSASITWSVPTVPAGSILQYRIYLGGTLLADNLGNTQFTIPGLLPGQVYTGSVVAFISPVDSSIASFSITVYNGTVTPDSIQVLSQVYGDGGRTYEINYDPVNHRLTGWSAYYNSYNYDSTQIFYNGQGKVQAIAVKNPAAENNVMDVAVYAYNAQGQAVKAYHKRGLTFDGSLTWLTTVNFPLDFQYEIESYDSLNYNTANKVISAYNCGENGIREYRLFSYQPGNDSLLARVDLYWRDGPDLRHESFVVNGYTNKPNPYYALCSKLPLMIRLVTRPLIVPFESTNADFHKYLLGNPYMPVSINGEPYEYLYWEDGSVKQIQWGQSPLDYVRFLYKKVPR